MPPLTEKIRQIVRVVRTGLVLLGDEAKWAFLSALHRWEIRQLEKRLQQEYRILGRYIHEHIHEKALQKETVETLLRSFSGQGPEQEPEQGQLLLQQITFLQQECDYLKEENLRKRQASLAARTRE